MSGDGFIVGRKVDIGYVVWACSSIVSFGSSSFGGRGSHFTHEWCEDVYRACILSKEDADALAAKVDGFVVNSSERYGR